MSQSRTCTRTWHCLKIYFFWILHINILFSYLTVNRSRTVESRVAGKIEHLDPSKISSHSFWKNQFLLTWPSEKCSPKRRFRVWVSKGRDGICAPIFSRQTWRSWWSFWTTSALDPARFIFSDGSFFRLKSSNFLGYQKKWESLNKDTSLCQVQFKVRME